jgi:hypothetical protein
MTRPGPPPPASVFSYIADVTGRYESGPGAFVSLNQVLESLVQATYRGTGGERHWATMQSIVPASGAYVVMQSAPWSATTVDPAAVTPVDVSRQLAFVRHYLSLNTTDLSKILLVERPTVYAWLDGRWDPKQSNKGRIRKLYQFARNWHEVSKQPIGKLLYEPIDGDASLMDYLVRNTLEVAAINRAIGLIREMSERKAKTKRVRSVREVAKLRGFKPISSLQENEQFDQMTRF